MGTSPAYPSQLNVDVSPEVESDVAFFKRWGYLVVEDAIQESEIEDLRRGLDNLFSIKKEQFIHELLEEGECFTRLLENSKILKRMQAILGSCIQLHSATGRVVVPGAEDQNWHRDVPWPVSTEGTPYGALPGQINCGYYLDELTDERGPTMVRCVSPPAALRPGTEN